MKTKILFSVALLVACTISMSVNAQLTISATGKAGVGLSETATPQSLLSVGGEGLSNARMSVIHQDLLSNFINSQYGIYSKLGLNAIGSTSTMCSVYGLSYGKAYKMMGVAGIAGINNLMSSGHIFGVYGVAGKATSGWNYGVYGMLMENSGNGAGVYGTNESSESIVAGRYAGYFKGQTKVNGDLYCSTITTTSDARLKTNISEIKDNAVQKVQALHPVQFNWQQIDYSYEEDSAVVKKMYFSDDTEYDRTHYGFIAQDVQKLFPDLVHEDAEGYLGVNYVELIPVLVQAIQELSAQVEELKLSSTRVKAPAGLNNVQSQGAIDAVLYQNNPNPFSVDTKIVYQLPLSTQNATLYIYDMNGLQIAEYPIITFGEGSIVVSAGTLDAGMYLYSLVADGQVIDTKRMILTK